MLSTVFILAREAESRYFNLAAKISKETFLSALAVPDKPTSSKPALTTTTNENTVFWLASDGMNQDHWDLDE